MADKHDSATCDLDKSWKALYRVGGIAILVAFVFFQRQTGTELTAFTAYFLTATQLLRLGRQRT